MMVGLVASHSEEKTVRIDAKYLKVHQTASRMGIK